MYSIDKCNFCTAKLKVADKNQFIKEMYCDDCYDSYKYNLSLDTKGGWLVTFSIKGYYFQMFYKVFSELNETLEIVCPDNEIISIPECRLITLDNYLQEIDRARNLQLFK